MIRKISGRPRTSTITSASSLTPVATSARPMPFLRVGEAWPALLELGVAQVTLFEVERKVYGPMKLSA